jgi:hypothetical protein
MPDSPDLSSIQTTEEADEAAEAIWNASDEAPQEDDSSPAEEEAAPQESDSDTGSLPSRDEKGRFVSREDHPDEATPSDEKPETAAEEAPPESPASPDEPEEGQTDEVPAPAEPPDYPTFRYRADGRDYEVPGSAYGESGTFIPTAEMEKLTRLVQEGHTHRGSFKQILNDKQREIDRAATGEDAARAELTAIKDKIEQLVTDPTEFERFIENLRGNWAVTKAQAEAESHKKLLDTERAQRESWEQEREEARLQPMMRQRLERTLVLAGKEMNLGADILKFAYQRLQTPEYLDRLYPRAEADNPQTGLKKGQRLDINVRMVQDELEYLASVTKGRVVEPTPNPKVEAAKAQAAKAASPTKEVKTPPTVSTKGGTAPTASKKKVPTFTSAEEADDWLRSGKYEELFDD